MLTEPATGPQARWPRLGVLVGVLAAPSSHFGGVYLTPELALLVGNAFAFLVSPNGKFALAFTRVERTADTTYDFVFISSGSEASRQSRQSSQLYRRIGAHRR